MQKITTQKFELPKKLINELYECSGAGDKYKGYIVVACNENGDPVVSTDSEATVVYFGLLKGLEKFLLEEAME